MEGAVGLITKVLVEFKVLFANDLPLDPVSSVCGAGGLAAVKSVDKFLPA